MEAISKANKVAKIEWQTAALIVACYGTWIALLLYGDHLNASIWIFASAINITLFMSITHEVVHGHPTRNDLVNRLMVLIPIGWSIPFERFRETHLDHHKTAELTDPFDDPETWYLTHHEWILRNKITRSILTFNNTLFGRMLIGPVIGLGRFYISEFRSMLTFENGWRDRAASWAMHFSFCATMVWLANNFGNVPFWQWLAAIYLGHSILLIRTYLEHQAAPDNSERTVIIETACPIAFLFLFNNYHFVHHNKPHIPWYQLPSEYRKKREQFLAENGAYVYRSYAEIFRMFFLRSKEPVAHPFLRHP